MNQEIQEMLQDEYLSREFIPVIIPYFEVSSYSATYFFDTAEFTKQVGITPTSTWRQKLKHLINVEGVPQTHWTYRFQPINAEWLELGTDAILSLCYPLRDIIKPYVQERDIRTTVYLRIYTPHREKLPLMNLSQKTMRQICELGSEFQIDIYPIERIEPQEKILIVSTSSNEEGDRIFDLKEME